jgi:hypothetical protein
MSIFRIAVTCDLKKKTFDLVLAMGTSLDFYLHTGTSWSRYIGKRPRSPNRSRYSFSLLICWLHLPTTVKTSQLRAQHSPHPLLHSLKVLARSNKLILLPTRNRQILRHDPLRIHNMNTRLLQRLSKFNNLRSAV